MLILESNLRNIIKRILKEDVSSYEDAETKNIVKIKNVFGSADVELKEINGKPFYYGRLELRHRKIICVGNISHDFNAFDLFANH